MFKVVVKTPTQILIHSFASEPEAKAYILGIRETNHANDVQIKLNGHRVTDANPKQRSG